MDATRTDLDLLMRSAEELLLVATDEARLLGVATELLGEQYGYGARYVVLHDAATAELYLGGAAGDIASTTAIKDYRRPDGAGLSGACWTSGQIVNAPDVHADPRYMEVLPTCRSEICVPIVAGSAVLGVLGVQSDRLAAFGDHDERLLAAYARLLAMGLTHARQHQARQRDLAELQAAHDEIRRLSVTDELTGAYNASHAMQRLREHVELARRHSAAVSLLFVDGDRIKQINDRHGHADGNALLAAMAGTLRAQLRTSDVLGRFGGDEFMVVLPHTNAIEALIVAQRLRKAVGDADYRSSSDERMRVTVSVGVATFPDDGATADEIFRAADRSLYRAKDGGRNRVGTP